MAGEDVDIILVDATQPNIMIMISDQIGVNILQGQEQYIRMTPESNYRVTPTPNEVLIGEFGLYAPGSSGGGGGGGGSAGHIIENVAGTDYPARTHLQFIGATVSDDSANNRTKVTISASATGHWAPVTNGWAAFPELVFDEDGELVMDFVETAL